MRYCLLLLLIVVLPLSALAEDYQADCTIAFHGSSTLHDFHGTGRCQPFIVSEQAGLLTIPEVAVPVASLDTDNARRDKQMRAMFDAETFPLVTGRTAQVSLAEVRKALADKDGGEAGFPIVLKIRDIEADVPARVLKIAEHGPALTADLAFSLSLASYQLEPPSVLGIIRVADQIDVTASFILKPR